MTFTNGSALKRFVTTLMKCLQRVRIVPTNFRSGTHEYPAPVDAFNAAIGDLVRQVRITDKACFKAKGCKSEGLCKVGWRDDGLLSLSWEATDLELTFSFPYKCSLEAIFLEKGIKIPDSWELVYFKRGRRARLRFKKCHANAIGPFLDSVFRQLYGCPGDYTVHGYIAVDYTHFV